jgi:hypothetical protein
MLGIATTVISNLHSAADRPVKYEIILFQAMGEQDKPLQELCLYRDDKFLADQRISDLPGLRVVEIPSDEVNGVGAYLRSRTWWGKKLEDSNEFGTYKISIWMDETKVTSLCKKDDMKAVVVFFRAVSKNKSVQSFSREVLGRL